MSEPNAPAPRPDADQLYRVLFETAMDAIFILANGRFVRCNARTLELFGCEESEILGRRPRDFSPLHQPGGQTSEERATELLAAVDAGEPRSFEWLHQRPDGRMFLAEVSLARFEVESTPHLLAIVRDVTERERVAGERRRLSAILAATSDLVATSTPDGRITFMNRAGRELLGWPLEGDLNPRQISDAHPPWAYAQVRDEGIPAALECGTWRCETAILNAEREELPVSQVIMAHRSSTGGEVEYLSTVMRDLRDLQRAQEALSASELRYRTLFERSADAILIIDGETFVDCNEATVTMLRYRDKRQLLRTHPSELSPEYQPDGRPSYEKANEMIAIAFENGSHRFEWDHRRADGEVFPVEVLLTAIPMGAQRLLHVVWRDITERKRAEREKEQLEAQLRQAQRMEAFGQLAGGVAHDFNNILTAILGNTELAQSILEAESEADASLVQSLEQIEQAGLRAARLTRQLLAFSRRQVFKPERLDLNHILSETEKMLRRLLTEDIELRTELAPDLHIIRADAGQIEQVILNLVVNARDAMPDGGVLTLETANRSPEGSALERNAEARQGSYVMLAVRDTGIGMRAEVQPRIFEPFFTTKPVGQGTGLGLATVYGIVSQAGGHIEVRSLPGEGAHFEIYLPALEPLEAGELPVADPAGESGGTETILVCEDEETVRALAGKILGEAGYTVLLASNGVEALERVADHTGEIDLLLSDVIMPDMNGRELAEQLVALRPALRVLFVSGYTADIIAKHGVLERGVEFLEKPFNRLALLQRVRQLLDGAAGSSQKTR